MPTAISFACRRRGCASSRSMARWAAGQWRCSCSRRTSSRAGRSSCSITDGTRATSPMSTILWRAFCAPATSLRSPIRPGAASGRSGDIQCALAHPQHRHTAPVQVLDYVDAIEAALGVKAIRELLPRQAADVPDTFADVSEISTRFGYRRRRRCARAWRGLLRGTGIFSGCEGGPWGAAASVARICAGGTRGPGRRGFRFGRSKRCVRRQLGAPDDSCIAHRLRTRRVPVMALPSLRAPRTPATGIVFCAFETPVSGTMPAICAVGHLRPFRRPPPTPPDPDRRPLPSTGVRRE